jgi:integration host factor subunit alpha
MVKKNLTRKEISYKIYKNIGFSKRLSSKILEDFFEFIIQELIESNKLKISSFGTFSILNKRERMGRNPKTKVLAKILSRKVVKFKPSDILKKKINS